MLSQMLQCAEDMHQYNMFEGLGRGSARRQQRAPLEPFVFACFFSWTAAV